MNRVYVMLSDDSVEFNKIKIGVTKNIEQRITMLQHKEKCKIIQSFLSEESECAFLIEKQIHKHFKNYSLGHEWFSCSFENAVSHIKDNFKIYHDKFIKKLESILTIKNVPDHQYEWVKKKAMKNGSNMSVIIKMLIQEQVEKEEMAQDLKKVYG